MRFTLLLTSAPARDQFGCNASERRLSGWDQNSAYNQKSIVGGGGGGGGGNRHHVSADSRKIWVNCKF